MSTDIAAVVATWEASRPEGNYRWRRVIPALPDAFNREWIGYVTWDFNPDDASTRFAVECRPIEPDGKHVPATNPERHEIGDFYAGPHVREGDDHTQKIEAFNTATLNLIEHLTLHHGFHIDEFLARPLGGVRSECRHCGHLFQVERTDPSQATIDLARPLRRQYLEHRNTDHPVEIIPTEPTP